MVIMFQLNFFTVLSNCINALSVMINMFSCHNFVSQLGIRLKDMCLLGFHSNLNTAVGDVLANAVVR